MCGIREYRTGSSEQLITCAYQANVVSETSCRRHSGTGGGEQKQERRRQDESSEAQQKNKKKNMRSKNPTMLVLCAILLVLPKAEAIKFSAEGVSVP